MLKNVNEGTLDVICEMMRLPNWEWWLVTDDNYANNLRKINPLKQRQVEKICEVATKTCCNILDKIIIFGSSVTYRCNSCSDLDICFKWKENPFENEECVFFKSEVLQLFNCVKEVTKSNNGYDMVFWDEVQDTRLGENIKKEGVVVYG